MNARRLLKTPLWDIDPFPSLLFDPDAERAQKLATGLRDEGLPVEIAASAAAMLSTAREKYIRTLVVVVDLDDADCLAFLDQLRQSAPGSWIVAIGARADEDALAIARRHGVDSLLVLSAPMPELSFRISSLQLRSRPRF